MAIHAIEQGADNSFLRTVTTKVEGVTKDVKKLLKDLKETLEDVGGLGVAAPQVGSGLRVCLALINGKMTPLINPEITWRSDETWEHEEGCLSLPNVDVVVTRPKEITLKYLDENGSVEERRLKEWDARIVQHEVDHLEGVLIVDYSSK